MKNAPSFSFRFWRLHLPVLLGLILVYTSSPAGAQSYTSTTATTAWNASRWSTNIAGPFTSTYTANSNVIFTSGSYTFGGMGATTNVGNITVQTGANVNFASIGSTFATGGTVRTIDVATGSVFDFNGQTLSTAAGTGFIKNGGGVLGTGAGAFTGGFTLNAGTVIARGTTGLGSGTGNVLNLNGGTLASNASRDFADTRFPGGINVGGNIQFGELSSIISIASSTANLGFANAVSLGSAIRTLTMGNNGTTTFSGVISNTSGGITFAANANTDGRFEITNAANSFTGDITITGGEVRFTTDGSMGNAANDIYIDGGRFAKASDSTTVTLGAGRQIFIGDGIGTAISSPGSGILVYNGVIADITANTGSWAKQGGGTLELGGVSTYTGDTAINNGIVRLTTGSNRLPTGTVLSLGQAASANLGTLNLNGFSQEIAGLNSIIGTNASVNTNVVTSASAATLTIGGAGSYSYSSGTAANSGVITGSIALIKNGTGSQTFGGANTYDGGTTINDGTLIVNNTAGSGLGTGSVDVIGGLLTGTGTINGAVTIHNGGSLGGSLTLTSGTTILGTHSPGFSPGIDSHTNLTYNGANILWELIGNTTSGRGTNFDGINVSGTLDFASATTLTLDFNLTGSTVDWADLAFWNANPTWLLFNLGGSGNYSNLTNLSVVGSNWFDGNDVNEFDDFWAGSFFEVTDIGGDLYLRFNAIPEPSRLLLVGLGALGLIFRRRRA